MKHQIVNKLALLTTCGGEQQITVAKAIERAYEKGLDNAEGKWRSIAERDLPPVDAVVLLRTQQNPHHIPELGVARHVEEKDGTTYWDVWMDQQYSIGEKWTHWLPIPVKVERA